jgi:hypothetical protein
MKKPIRIDPEKLESLESSADNAIHGIMIALQEAEMEHMGSGIETGWRMVSSMICDLADQLKDEDMVDACTDAVEARFCADTWVKAPNGDEYLTDEAQDYFNELLDNGGPNE